MAVVTISRLLGSGGDEIAQKVAEGLKYNLVDSGLILRVAERAGVSIEEVENFDEKYHSRAVEWLKNFIAPRIGKIMTEDKEHLNPEKYIEFCSDVVSGLAEEGKMVIVGRGGQYILKDFDRAFHVRVFADDEFRIGRISGLYGISSDDAREMMKKSDRMRAYFIERYFHGDWYDSKAYHMTIDSSKLGIDAAAYIIIEATRQFSRTYDFIPGVRERRGPDRRLKGRRKGERRDPTNIWTLRDMENAVFHEGRPIRSYNKPDRRMEDRRKGPRR
ncbi:cytidylate kinase-like family protein [bacterium]|nr:cytidylate kinase-like family protein [bacterium]